LSTLKNDTVLRLLIRGRVHGVGFRASLAAQARSLGVCGWVRNRRDGSVEAMLAGADDAVQRLRAWAHRGPPAAVVDSVEAEPAEGCFEGFELRSTV
jgi:acylphosphatase